MDIHRRAWNGRSGLLIRGLGLTGEDHHPSSALGTRVVPPGEAEDAWRAVGWVGGEVILGTAASVAETLGYPGWWLGLKAAECLIGVTQSQGRDRGFRGSAAAARARPPKYATPGKSLAGWALDSPERYHLVA
jgi:hypothetical protein